MLSICIPVYNTYIEELYQTLLNQTTLLNNEIEIIIIDDCSLDLYKEKNKKTCIHAHYIELQKNIGRAKIRNLFLDYAKFENLLFLDCDSKIIHKNYLKNYIDTLKQTKEDVIFGGSIYHSKKPNRKHLLRWEYGTKKENKAFHIREKIGNKAFLTNNFLINRTTFNKVKFDETLIKYGYEDTLFNYELNRNGFTITQMDNSVLNNEFDTNSLFLSKVSESIDNLHLILKNTDNKQAFINHVKILRTYQTLKDKKLTGVFNLLFTIKKPIIKKMLLSGYYGNLLIFNLYKLGLLIHKLEKEPIE
jgi:hypothetical protein